MNDPTPNLEAALSTGPRQLRGPFARWPRSADAVLAIGLFVLLVFVSFEEPDGDLVLRSAGDLPLGEFILMALACGALIRRRSRPLVVLGVTLATSTLSLLLGYTEAIGFAMLVALYSLGRYVSDDRQSYFAVSGALAVVTIESVIDGAPASDLRVRFPGAIRGVVHRQTGPHSRRLRETPPGPRRATGTRTVGSRSSSRYRRANPHRPRVARRCRPSGNSDDGPSRGRQDGCRRRHAGCGAGNGRPSKTRDDKRWASSGTCSVCCGRKPRAMDLRPSRGFADVPRLVEQFREAGLEASLTMDAGEADLPARVDLSAYRIVQEALTNVVKHAGVGARARVRLSIQNGEVTIEVLDSGHGASSVPGLGHGIVGMRERALLLNGSLDVGQRPGSGFQVVAHLPVGDEPA